MSRFKSVGKTEHGFFEERLSSYLDGELASHEHEAVEHHLKTCSACQWELETLAQTIQWTRELPTLQVPRVFTVPVPAEPARSSVRRRNFLPVLQGATALIAVLLVFAVAGDLMLGSRPMGGGPDAPYREEIVLSEVEAVGVEEAPVAEEAAIAAEAPVPAEAPAPAEPELGVEEMVIETVVETVVVELEVIVEPTEAPLAEGISPTRPLLIGEAMAPEATPSPTADRATWESPEEEVVEEEGVPETDVEEGEAVQRLAEEDALAGGGPTMTLTAPSPPISATELALAPVAKQDESELRTSGEAGINWLRVIEVSLGGLLVLLAAATIVFTIERRRAR